MWKIVHMRRYLMFDELILQVTRFPGAEAIHSLQGVVIGVLLARGYLKGSLERVGIAIALMAGFAIYEGYERWRIMDEADVDFQVMLITAWLSAMITLAVHLLWGRNK